MKRRNAQKEHNSQALVSVLKRIEVGWNFAPSFFPIRDKRAKLTEAGKVTGEEDEERLVNKYKLTIRRNKF